MSLIYGNFPEDGRAEAKVAYAITSRLPVRHWPDRCPDCDARMEFQFEPEVRRACPACGTTVMDRDGAFVTGRGDMKRRAA